MTQTCLGMLENLGVRPNKRVSLAWPGRECALHHVKLSHLKIIYLWSIVEIYATLPFSWWCWLAPCVNSYILLSNIIYTYIFVGVVSIYPCIPHEIPMVIFASNLHNSDRKVRPWRFFKVLVDRSWNAALTAVGDSTEERWEFDRIGTGLCSHQPSAWPSWPVALKFDVYHFVSDGLDIHQKNHGNMTR